MLSGHAGEGSSRDTARLVEIPSARQNAGVDERSARFAWMSGEALLGNRHGPRRQLLPASGIDPAGLPGFVCRQQREDRCSRCPGVESPCLFERVHGSTPMSQAQAREALLLQGLEAKARHVGEAGEHVRAGFDVAGVDVCMGQVPELSLIHI